MRFVFGYAGIPSDVYDYIYSKRKTLTGTNTDFEGVSLGPFGSSFEPRHAKTFLARFKDRALEERGDGTSSTAYAIVYVRADPESTLRFEEAFFPTTLTIPVDWRPHGFSGEEIRQSRNELFQLLLQATIRARAALTALHKEAVERASRTPLLLPVRNFRSKQLKTWMQQLQNDVIAQPNFVAATATVTAAVRAFEVVHPLKKVEDPKRKRPCFLDDADVEFHAPGKALHGLPHASDEHPPTCILGGYRRLGAPFNAAFHYDCIRGVRGNLKGLFFRCHQIDAETLEGDPHINIAPNDFVRI